MTYFLRKTIAILYFLLFRVVEDSKNFQNENCWVIGERELRNLDLWFRYGEDERSAVLRQLGTGINISHTTSMGRVLDAVSALLGICHHRSYEGEPAMKLESVARRGLGSDAGAPTIPRSFREMCLTHHRFSPGSMS